ncbi:MAG: hypothetical protein HXO65_00260 [Rothia mucilaginosa]|uniref:Uncharacterized protein n=1 Tax=Rothia mucilaginosa TaxID=43675 RepID=A0A930PYU0_9MICC|nr:hypothetical protein [Rothia mucilaginosa]
MAFTMDTVIPQFSGLDGLKYDATVVALEGKVIPIAFSETITHARDGARFNTFTSARGVQSISYRGDAPRSLSVAVNKVPWKYVATVIALESMQRKPLYVITSLSRRLNVLPPWLDWSDVLTGRAPSGSWHESSLNKTARTLNDIARTEMASLGPYLMEVINTKNAHIYGREASLPAGVVYRFRAGVQASAGATATVGLVGFDKNGNKVWESPNIQATSNWEVKTSNRFIIPEGVSYVRDYYEAGLRSFSPIQLWIGEHEPPPAPRMGGTFQIADLSFTEAPSTKAKLYDVSFTLKEVAP